MIPKTQPPVPDPLRDGGLPGFKASVALVALVAALIAYASLYPFDLSPSRFLDRWQQGTWWSLRMSGRGDVVANLLFYLPLGLLIGLRAGRARGAMTGILLAALGGASLSISMELMQLASATRSSSALDVLLNTASAMCGAMASRAPLLFNGRHRAARWFQTTPDAAMLLAPLAWFSWHCAPFLPQISLSDWKDAVRPAFALQFELGGFAKHGAAYLMIAMLLRLALQPRVFWPALWLTFAASVIARVVFVDQSLSINELTGGFTAVLLIYVWRGRTDRDLTPLVVAGAIVAYVVHGLDPFDFTSAAQAFEWIPFRGHIERELGAAVVVMSERLYLFSATIYLAALTPLGLKRATILIAVIAGIVEGLQCFLPSRGPEISEPLLALVAGTALHYARAMSNSTRIPTPRP